MLADTHIAPNLMKIIKILFCKNVAQTNDVKCISQPRATANHSPQKTATLKRARVMTSPPRGETNQVGIAGKKKTKKKY